MTIFDTLKYPIPETSLPEAIAAFEQLPEELQEAYRKKIVEINGYLTVRDQVNLLRKVILEYDT
jgi:hypothetical protein